MSLIYPSSTNAVQKTLDAALLAGATTSVTLNSVTGIQDKAGVFVVDRVDANGSATPSKREYVSFTGVSGSTLTGLTRNADGGGSDQDHAVGAIVEFVSDVLQQQAILDTIEVEHNADGTHAVVTATSINGNTVPTGTDEVALIAEAQTLTNKTLTSPVINTGLSGTAKATATEVATGTEDAKFTTPLAVAPYANNYIYRQAIINGNFDVWQRGTSFTPGNGDYMADRWQSVYVVDGGTLPTDTFTRAELTPGDIDSAFAYLKLTVDGAGSGFGSDSYYAVAQKIEHATRFLAGASKTVTISFWAKSDIADKKIGIWLQQYYGSGGTPSATEIINGANWTLTSSWTKYTHTFTTNTLSGKTFGTNDNDYFRLYFAYQWGDTIDANVGDTVAEDFVGAGDIDIAQVQLCAGDVALPFMPKSYEDELRACQRYYIKMGGATYSRFGAGQCSSTTTGAASIQFSTEMRVAPTIEQSGNFAFTKADGSVQAITVAPSIANFSDKSCVALQASTAGNLVAGNSTFLLANNDATAYIAFTAEL